MSFDINNVYTGSMYGRDRIGHTTPDPDASEPLRPWLVVPYPAPYLPSKRQDQGHPVLANIVISAGQLVGLDGSGALVPAGLFSGTQAAIGSGGQYCVLAYSAYDIGFTFNPQTGARVASATEYAVIAAPTDGAAGNTVTLPNGQVITITAPDVAFGKNCTLMPGGVAKAIGYAIRNVFQYIGGVTISNAGTIDSGADRGMQYKLDGVLPTNFIVHNYMHEMGTAIQTHFVLRMPWIGAVPTTLGTLASGDSITGYSQTDYSRSFVHFTGTSGNSAGNLFRGCSVVASRAANGVDAGNFAPYNSAVHSVDEIVGRVIGVENIYPIKDFANRVRTQFERAETFLGPVKDPNPSTIQMGGSATRGIDYMIHITTNGIFRKAYDQAKTLRPEYSTYVLVHVNAR